MCPGEPGILEAGRVSKDMKLTLHEAGRELFKGRLGNGRVHSYNVGGLPPKEEAKIAHFGQVWRILRWNDEWHGNWTGEYASPEAALDALRAELVAPT
jgi:hypothetical protein